MRVRFSGGGLVSWRAGATASRLSDLSAHGAFSA